MTTDEIVTKPGREGAILNLRTRSVHHIIHTPGCEGQLVKLYEELNQNATTVSLR